MSEKAIKRQLRKELGSRSTRRRNTKSLIAKRSKKLLAPVKVRVNALYRKHLEG